MNIQEIEKLLTSVAGVAIATKGNFIEITVFCDEPEAGPAEQDLSQEQFFQLFGERTAVAAQAYGEKVNSVAKLLADAGVKTVRFGSRIIHSPAPAFILPGRA